MTISAVRLDEQAVAVMCAQTPRVFEQDVGFALAHFAEHDDVAWVLVGNVSILFLRTFCFTKKRRGRGGGERTASYS